MQAQVLTLPTYWHISGPARWQLALYVNRRARLNLCLGCDVACQPNGAEICKRGRCRPVAGL